ncbi:isochorismatase family cysteine hydrolase [Nitratireductor sp. XY-223]|uniref:cysteine hydrolase family protein n=1 Tax=Nitratireductor sp. XY-223 TaxID=2561926 RepID=UPI0010A9E3A2|nr:isochorismatase family cysteine hydrolase [Nitratireductor sp. XY-223]
MEAYVYGNRRILPPEFQVFNDVGNTAVISVDMHQGHLSDSPECPCPAPRARDVVDPINDFHRLARAAKVPVIHVRSVLRKGGVDDINGVKSAWRMTFPLHVGDIPNADEHAIEGTRWTEFVTEVTDDDLVVSGKKRLSPFFATDLDFLLRQMGTKVVVLNGGMTDCCILNAAFDASNYGYRVIVAGDLVRGTDQNLEAAGLSIVSLHLGLVMDADDIMAMWSART